MDNSYCARRSLDGCGGRLCRSCAALLTRMTLERYPEDDYGQLDLTAEPLTGQVCGFTSKERGRDGAVKTAGHSGGLCLRLTVVATDTGGVKRGDRITVGETVYRVASTEGKHPVTASLLPAE